MSDVVGWRTEAAARLAEELARYQRRTEDSRITAFIRGHFVLERCLQLYREELQPSDPSVPVASSNEPQPDLRYIDLINWVAQVPDPGVDMRSRLLHDYRLLRNDTVHRGYIPTDQNVVGFLAVACFFLSSMEIETSSIVDTLYSELRACGLVPRLYLSWRQSTLAEQRLRER